MRYPVAIEPGSEQTAFGVIVPDLPGCFSAGDTLDEAVANAQEAAAAWIEATLDAGGEIPEATSIRRIQALPDFHGWEFGSIEVSRAVSGPRPIAPAPRSASG